MKKNNRIANLFRVCMVIIIAVIGMKDLCTKAAVSDVTVEGKQYVFDKDVDYDFSSSSNIFKAINGKTDFGSFSLTGDIKSTTSTNGVPSYEVGEGTINFKYSLYDTYVNAGEYSWHTYNDTDNEVNGIELKDDILSGAVIVQTSLTGSDWITDAVYRDIRNAENGYTQEFYATRRMQQLNGCYYRIIIVYELQKRVEDSTVLFIPISNHEYQRIAEVYSFYVKDSSENASGKVSPYTIPMMNLTNIDSKINTGTNNGFSGHEDITRDDPHYGWEMGTFFVNGYTESTTENGVPVFLKNVGDRVTLWFILKQNIDELNGNKNLKVSENDGGSDQQFEIQRTDFGRGTLIIRYTDYHNEKHDPIIYTNYLASCARTGADTMVELFEEGNYEVALDYKVVDEKGIDTYTDYRIYFRFEIRNSNCMAYPFELISGTELTDGAITENGFRLDLAKSRYLSINVERKNISYVDGKYVEDSRFNGMAKEGESYTEEGIYIFTVTNRYTNSTPGTKKIYVGTSPILKALAKNDMALSEINSILEEGAEILGDGSIYIPEPTPEPIEMTDIKTGDEADTTETLERTFYSLGNNDTKAKILKQSIKNRQEKKNGSTAADREEDDSTVESENMVNKELSEQKVMEWFKMIAIIICVSVVIICELKRIRKLDHSNVVYEKEGERV